MFLKEETEYISPTPFNPAVVVSLAVARRFPRRYVWLYWLAQVGGALGASKYTPFPDRAIAGHYGATIPTVGIGQAVGIEAVITFFLMLVSMADAKESLML